MIALALLAAKSNNGLVTLLPILLMVVVFYFLLIRPQQRQRRMQQQLVQSLDVGDEVITGGGIFGTVRHVEDDAVDLEVSPGTTIRVLKIAVARRVSPEEEEPEDEEASETS